jgi:hypothetical protein
MSVSSSIELSSINDEFILIKDELKFLAYKRDQLDDRDIGYVWGFNIILKKARSGEISYPFYVHKYLMMTNGYGYVTVDKSDIEGLVLNLRGKVKEFEERLELLC